MKKGKTYEFKTIQTYSELLSYIKNDDQKSYQSDSVLFGEETDFYIEIAAIGVEPSDYERVEFDNELAT